jgi:hypothetical protein
VDAVVYVGDSRSREVIRQFEFAPSQPTPGDPGRKQFEVMRASLALPSTPHYHHHSLLGTGKYRQIEDQVCNAMAAS